MKLAPALALVAFSFVPACSSSAGSSTGGPGGSAYDPLFTAPANAPATAGDVHGLWGGSASVDGIDFDYRFEFGDAKVTLANRCKFPDGVSLTVGTDATARITDHDVTMLESKSDHEATGSDSCNADLKPGTYTYAIAGLALTLTGPNGATLTMVKIHD